MPLHTGVHEIILKLASQQRCSDNNWEYFEHFALFTSIILSSFCSSLLNATKSFSIVLELSRDSRMTEQDVPAHVEESGTDQPVDDVIKGIQLFHVDCWHIFAYHFIAKLA